MDKLNVKKQHLPYPPGPYATGCMELMTEYSSEGSFARIFYPTNIPTEQLSKYSDKWVHWIPHEKYFKEFASALRVPFFIFKYGSIILKQGPYFIPTISDAQLSDKEQSYPLVIFSHGYAASRFVCSDYCNSLASHGFIVAAIEHRDGSSPITYYYDSPKSVENDKRTWIPYYPFNHYNDSDNYTSKNKQLKMRHSECTKLLDTLLAINDGVSVENVLKSSFQLSQFKNKIKTDKIITSGFSFGGATAMYGASKDSRYKAAVILDGWMFPIKSEPFLDIRQPMVFVNSQTFHFPSNLNVLRKYYYCDNTRRQLYTLKNTTHESHTDTAYLFGYWLDLLMLKKMEPRTALNLQTSLVIAFLRDTIGCPSDCDGARVYIKEHGDDFVEDSISYTRRVRRKIGVYPW